MSSLEEFHTTSHFSAGPTIGASSSIPRIGSPEPSTPSWEILLTTNDTNWNATSGSSFGIIYGPVAATFMITIFTVITVGTILGNLLVLSSVVMVKKLQAAPNILIINLALADIAVALLVMPFAASYDLSGQWIFNQRVCDMFISFDVMCCTASIVDLCFISVDRYLAITRPFRYARHRTKKLMIGVVAIVWAVSALISFSPLFIFGNEHMENQCLLSQDPIYTIYSTFGAFYIPLFIMVVVYYKIYQAAGDLERKELQRRPSTPGLFPRGSLQATRSNSLSSDSDSVPEHAGRAELRRKSSMVRFADYMSSVSRQSLGSITVGKNRISLKLERKASKTLGIIMGAFVVCWLPFFVLAITRVFCNCEIPAPLHTFLVWLGYINSMLNPIIYPSFNKDFGPAYRKMLRFSCCRLCPKRLQYENDYEEAKRTPTPRRFTRSNSGINQHFVGVSPDLHAIAEGSHDESESLGKPSPVTNVRTDIQNDKDFIHLDIINGNLTQLENKEINATDV